MTPSELADRLESANVRRLQKGINNVPLWDVAAAMLREAERLLHSVDPPRDGPAALDHWNWIKDRAAWLDGQTP